MVARPNAKAIGTPSRTASAHEQHEEEKEVPVADRREAGRRDGERRGDDAERHNRHQHVPPALPQPSAGAAIASMSPTPASMAEARIAARPAQRRRLDEALVLDVIQRRVE